MFGRNRIRGLMAQAVYEELDLRDRESLDRALEESDTLRAEAEALGALAEMIPREAAELDRDLTLTVRAGIRSEKPVFRPRRAHWVVSSAALAVALFGVGTMIVLRSPVAIAPGIAEAPAVSDEGSSPVELALQEAESLMGDLDYPNAYVVLSRAVDGSTNTVFAGEARQLMADLAYGELRWYPEALADYDALRVHHNAVFQSKPENLLHLNLLDEARGRDDSYASLHLLDAARRGESLEDFEGVLSRYPATYVASLAADEMATLSAELDGLDAGGNLRVAALESALSRCTNPVARAQLKMEIGHAVSRDVNGAARARALYEEVAESENTVLAQLAQDSLERLGHGRR